MTVLKVVVMTMVATVTNRCCYDYDDYHFKLLGLRTWAKDAPKTMRGRSPFSP